MTTMNEVVQSRLGEFAVRLCEYEVIVARQKAHIAELEARLGANDASQAEAISVEPGRPMTGRDGLNDRSQLT